VAARAGVSLATVSRVMNGNPSVDPVLAEKVRRAAEELHYSASPLARSLVLGTTNTVAVVVPDLGNPTFQGVLRGLSRAAARDGYHIMIADSAESVAGERALTPEIRRRCDGIVLCSPRMADEDLRLLLAELRPVVLVNREAGAGAAPVVTADYRSALWELLERLYAHGHRSLLYLAGVPASRANVRRLDAVRQFARTHPETRLAIQECGVGFAEGHAAASAVLHSRATGVLAFNDLVAMGLLSALHERGVEVPGQVSVVGFDDIPFARYLTPPLTTVAVPVEDLGEAAWLRMWDLLNGRDPGPDVRFRPRVQWRASTGHAPSPLAVG
jgi:LacI family transcriptional regulator